jgi:hypothetical protein
VPDLVYNFVDFVFIHSGEVSDAKEEVWAGWAEGEDTERYRLRGPDITTEESQLLGNGEGVYQEGPGGGAGSNGVLTGLWDGDAHLLRLGDLDHSCEYPLTGGSMRFNIIVNSVKVLPPKTATRNAETQELLDAQVELR